MMRSNAARQNEHSPHAIAGRMDVEFETPAQLARALRLDRKPCELLLEGAIGNVEAGAEVHLSVTVRGHAPHSLRGVVLWRRMSCGPGFPAAASILLDRSEERELVALRTIARGQLEGEVRTLIADDVRDVVRWRSGARH